MTGHVALCYNAADMADLRELRRALERGDVGRRRRALEALEPPLPEQLIPAVRRLAEDQQAPPSLRVRAWRLLGEEPPEELRLAARLEAEPDARIAQLPPALQGAVLQAALEADERGALRALEAMWREGRLGAEVLRRLGASGGELLGEALARWLPEADPERRRAIRHALRRLQARGVRVREARPEGGWEAGYLSHLDPRGSRLVLLLREEPPYGLRLLQLILNDVQGVQRLEAALLRRSEWREHLALLRRRPDLWLVEAEPAHCRAVVAEACGRGGLPEEHRRWAEELLGDPAYLQPPPAQRLLGVEEPRLEALWRRSGELLECPAFAGWRLPPEELEGRRHRFDQARHTPLVLSPEQQRQRLREVLAELSRELFRGERLRVWRRRLEEMSYVLAKRGDRTLAELALSAAWAAERRDPGEHPFLVGLVERALEPARASAGLIVAPTEREVRRTIGERR